MMRTVLLALSERPAARDLMLKFGAGRRAVDRFVAGEELEQAIPAVRSLHDEGFEITLDLLGENVSHEEEARRATDAYIASIDGIRSAGLPSHISLKLTQLGLDLGAEVCRANLERVVRHAATDGSFVRIDMEGSDYTERTLEVFGALRGVHTNVGVVLQSMLRRSVDDLRKLAEAKVNVRICKGAYKEPSEIAFPAKSDVDASYVRMLDVMLDPEALARGAYPAIATHDEAMVAAALERIERHSVRPDQYEFQMLFGVRRDLQRRLREAGHRVRIYVPFGTEWYPYFMRRLAERPANVMFVLRALMSG